ncbi:FeS cluster assembly protein sufD [Serratia entomophila]|nr:FeS cluster assembly protein sufD [Serratia entomophila]
MAGLPTNNNSRALQQLYSLFEARGGEHSAHALAHWQQALRLGWPTRKHENWKYTPLEGLLEQRFLDPQAEPVTAARRAGAEHRGLSPGVRRRPFQRGAQRQRSG